MKGHIVRRFGGAWTPPARRVEGYIGMMRAVWRSWQEGERPAYHSDDYNYTLMTPAFSRARSTIRTRRSPSPASARGWPKPPATAPTASSPTGS